MAYGESNDDVIDDVPWPWKVKVVIPIYLRPVILKTAWERDSVLTEHHLPPQPYVKAVKKFIWRIYALSERLLVDDAAREAGAVAEMAAVRKKAKYGRVERAFFCRLQWRPWVS